MLTGVKVVDFSQNIPGPYATLRLADLGAEIIKVEPPSGDTARFPFEDDGEENFLFRSLNRNKKSIVINLKNKNEQIIVHKLLKEADILIESFRPGVMDKLGVGYENVKKINPSLIYCSISGYGQNSSLSHFGSHDLNFMALSGVLSQLKNERGEPLHPNITFADFIGGIAASEAIMAALLKRERTKKGSYIDLSLLDVMISLMVSHTTIHSATGEKHGLTLLNKEVICYHIYETKDGRFIVLAALESKFWENFCLAIGKKGWMRYQLSPPSDKNPIFEELKRLFKSKDFYEWKNFSEQVDCCMTPVLETDEMIKLSYVSKRSLIHQYEQLNFLKTRYSVENSEIIEYRHYPKLGEHTDYIKQLIE